MQLKFQSLFSPAGAKQQTDPPADAQARWKENLVTVTATTLGVLIVATVAVLLGMT